MAAQESAWSPAGKECDRACLVAIIDGYTNAGQVALQTRRSVQGRDNLSWRFD